MAAVAESPHAVNVNSLVLWHDVVPTALSDFSAPANPTISAQTFLDRPVLSDVAAFALEPATAHDMLSHYKALSGGADQNGPLVADKPVSFCGTQKLVMAPARPI